MTKKRNFALPKIHYMKPPSLNLRQQIHYERLITETGIKKCAHEHTFEDWCLVCGKKID